MKILQINKFWFPKGGAETHMLSLISVLQKNGHEIIGFSQKDKNNIKVNGDKYFISKISLDKLNISDLIKLPRIFWSFEAKKKIKQLIKNESPDIAHIHNIYHQISPSILPVLKKAGIPIVMTVHDFKLIDPEYTLWSGEKINTKPIISRLLMKLEFNFHKLIKIYKKNVDLFIVPSNFVLNKLIENGFDANKIIVLPHPTDKSNTSEIKNEENYIIYFGRLDKSKGIDILIKAFAEIKTNTILKIIGSGSEKENLESLAKKLKINNIEFISHIEKQELQKIISHSMFSVFPSLVHETFGLGITESYALGKPVIASGVGAFTENVQDGGILVESGNITELKNAIEKLINDKELRSAMAKKALEISKNKLSSDDYYDKLMEIYKSANIKKKHYKLEKDYAKKIISTPKGEERNKIISLAYDEINTLVNRYRKDGIRGHNNSTFEIIKKNIGRESRILDYGCGTGELVNLLNKNNYNAHGFDVSSEVTYEAEEKYNLKNKFFSEDINTIKNKYDLIVMDNVIEHIAPDEIQDTISNLKNLLTENGKLLVITPHRFAGPHDISGNFLPLGSKSTGLHLKEFNLYELVEELSKEGYKDIKGYLINPRILNLKPRKIWKIKSLLLEKIFSSKILSPILKLNKSLTRILIALMFPTIIIAKK